MTSRETLEGILAEAPGDMCAGCGVDDPGWHVSTRGGHLTHRGARASCRFPCAGACEHLDCADARRRLSGKRDLRRELESVLG